MASPIPQLEITYDYDESLIRKFSIIAHIGTENENDIVPTTMEFIHRQRNPCIHLQGGKCVLVTEWIDGVRLDKSTAGDVSSIQ